MIFRLRELDHDTFLADGPTFDLDKVVETAVGMLRTLVGRTGMQFPGGESETFDEQEFAEISWLFHEAKRTTYDVSDFHYVVEFGPFEAHLYLLGFEALHGPLNGCVTSYCESWEQLDPTPVVLIMRRGGMTDSLDGVLSEFLVKTVDSFLSKGIEWAFWGDAHALAVSFPHGTFGAGHGSLRICRYPEPPDHEEEG